MGLYEGVKDAIALAQKADNIELYRQLLDLGAQALEMQDEIRMLKEENAELKKVNDLESKIIRHDQPYITFSDDEKEIMYCASCWGNNKKTIQLICNHNDGTFRCPICKTHDIYDEEKYIKTSRIITNTALKY